MEPSSTEVNVIHLKLTEPIIQPNGTFANPWRTWVEKNTKDVFNWLWKDKKESQIPSSAVLQQTLPVKQPNFGITIPDDGVQMTWLGHASVLIQMDGVRVLCDPIFSQRCSPSRFFGPKRYRPPPCEIDQLPLLDVVVISNNHYDHLDVDSVKRIHRHQQELRLTSGIQTHLLWCVPAGVGPWLLGILDDHCHVEECTWWQEVFLPHRQDVRISFTPTQQWSGRALLDKNKSLWGSWCVLGPKHKAFFTGDTGYCEAFTQIGAKYGPFDLAAIPIGAYEPRWYMSPQHVNPEEAIKIHMDIRSKRSMAIHWGTFTMTNEPYLEPASKLKANLELLGLNRDLFQTVAHGQSIYAKDNETFEIL